MMISHTFLGTPTVHRSGYPTAPALPPTQTRCDWQSRTTPVLFSTHQTNALAVGARAMRGRATSAVATSRAMDLMQGPDARAGAKTTSAAQPFGSAYERRGSQPAKPHWPMPTWHVSL